MTHEHESEDDAPLSNWLRSPARIWIVGVTIMLLLGGGALVCREYQRRHLLNSIDAIQGVEFAFVERWLAYWLPEWIPDSTPFIHDIWLASCDAVWVHDNLSKSDFELLAQWSEFRQVSFNGTSEVTDDMLLSFLEREPLMSLTFETPRRLTVKQLEVLCAKPSLNKLIGVQGPFEEAHFRAIAQARNLELLTLHGPLAQDANLRTLFDKSSSLNDLQWKNSDLSDDQFAALPLGTTTRTLVLEQTRLTRKSWAVLSGLPLWHFELQSPYLDADITHHLSTATKLEFLKLTGSSITDQGVAQLKSLPMLSTLELDATGLTVASAHSIREFGTTLDGLVLRNATNVTDEWLAELGQSYLECLTIQSSQVTDEGLRLLRPLRNSHLYRLNLPESRISDRGLGVLSKYGLRWLDLRNTEITDEGLQVLVRAINGSIGLRMFGDFRVHLGGTRVTRQAAERALKDHAWLKIYGIEGIATKESDDFFEDLPLRRTRGGQI